MGVSPGFANIGFLTISFDPASFLYTQGSSCTQSGAWDVPGTSTNVVWSIQLTNHGVQDVKLYKYSSMAFIQITSGSSASSSFNQLTFFVVAPNSCYGSQVNAYDVNANPYIIPKNAQNDTQTGGNPTWVFFAATAAGGTTPSEGWSAGSEFMIFMVFYFLYGATELYTQVIPFAGVHFT